MTCDVEHLVICLFVICVSSLLRRPFIFFGHLLVRLLFLLLSFKSYLYILGNSSLSNMCFANILSNVFLFSSLSSCSLSLCFNSESVQGVKVQIFHKDSHDEMMKKVIILIKLYLPLKSRRVIIS